jgi:hypothetical protein
VKVPDREELLLALLHPGDLAGTLALRAVAISARVVRRAVDPTIDATVHMTAEFGSPARLERPKDLPLVRTYDMRRPVRLGMSPQDVCELMPRRSGTIRTDRRRGDHRR